MAELQARCLQVAQHLDRCLTPLGREILGAQQVPQGLQRFRSVDLRTLRQLTVAVEALSNALQGLILNAARVGAPIGLPQDAVECHHPGAEGLLIASPPGLQRVVGIGGQVGQFEKGRGRERPRRVVCRFHQVRQQRVGGAPHRLLRQWEAAGDVEGPACVGELHPKGVVDGVIGVGQVRKDHPNAGVLIRRQRLARPLGGGADLVGTAFKPDANLGNGGGFCRGVMADPASCPFNPAEEVGHLRFDALKAQQVQAFLPNGRQVSQLCLGNPVVGIELSPKARCPALEQAAVGGLCEGGRFHVDSPRQRQCPGFCRQFR